MVTDFVDQQFSTLFNKIEKTIQQEKEAKKRKPPCSSQKPELPDFEYVPITES